MDKIICSLYIIFNIVIFHLVKKPLSTILSIYITTLYYYEIREKRHPKIIENKIIY